MLLIHEWQIGMLMARKEKEVSWPEVGGEVTEAEGVSPSSLRTLSSRLAELHRRFDRLLGREPGEWRADGGWKTGKRKEPEL